MSTFLFIVFMHFNKLNSSLNVYEYAAKHNSKTLTLWREQEYKREQAYNVEIEVMQILLLSVRNQRELVQASH